ncbi:MAG: SDR family oxidoreductase [Bacteroidota bacterium]
MSTSHSLSGKIALVTGGSRNIGKETALALAKHGADVIITYVNNAEAAQQTVSELEAHKARAKALQVDLTGTQHIPAFKQTVASVLEEWTSEHLHILVNNAGIAHFAPFDQVTEKDLDAIYNVNYKSVFFLTQAFSDLIADGGRIINLGSGTATHVFAPLVSYGPLKAAIEQLTKYLAGFLGNRRITVNAVAPGGLDNEFNAGLFQNMPQARDYIASQTAVGRVGVSGDIGQVIAFLSSDEASFISGSIIPVDGGFHL